MMTPHFQRSAWSQAQEDLKESMQQEVNTMREILSNIMAEEFALLNQDKDSWGHLMQTRFHMIEQVKLSRKNRMEATQRLLSLSEGNVFDSLLLTSGENGCEISLLLDQLIALSDKINFQNTRNQSLLENSEHFVAFQDPMRYPPHLYSIPTVKSRKSFLMTIP